MKKLRQHPVFVILLLISAICVGILIGLKNGYSHISYWDLLKNLFTEESDYYLVLWQIRLPRILLSILCGMGLAACGCVLQNITRNPLADPGILGINAGAGFMIMIYLTFFPALHINSTRFMPVFAFMGGMLVAGLLYAFSRRKGKINTEYMVMMGIGASAGFSALMLIIGADMENSSYQSVARWMAGNIWGSSWYQIKILIPYLIVLMPLLLLKVQTMDVLMLGEEVACSLGVKVEREQLFLLTAAVGISAACVSVSGGIGFIGLVAPHIARRLVGTSYKYLLPASVFLGGLLLLLADTVGRTLFQPIEVPVGIVISVLAAPYFLYLLRK